MLKELKENLQIITVAIVIAGLVNLFIYYENFKIPIRYFIGVHVSPTRDFYSAAMYVPLVKTHNRRRTLEFLIVREDQQRQQFAACFLV